MRERERLRHKQILVNAAFNVILWDHVDKQKVSHKYKCFIQIKQACGICGGQEEPQQHIHQVCILEQDMCEVICHENSAMDFFCARPYTGLEKGKKMNTASPMM